MCMCVSVPPVSFLIGIPPEEKKNIILCTKIINNPFSCVYTYTNIITTIQAKVIIMMVYILPSVSSIPRLLY
jgi:nucleoside permease NupC